jgi:hypothetical protein
VISVIALLCAAPHTSCQEPKKTVYSDEVAKRIREIREEFARRPQERFDPSRETTVRALIAIVQEESEPGGHTGTGHEALREVGSFLDDPRAVAFLVSQIDLEPALIAKASVLSGYHWTAAKTLLKGGPLVRRQILGALAEPLPDHKLYLMAYVLATLDNTGDEYGSGIPIAIYRLTREIEQIQEPPRDSPTRPPEVQERIRIKTKNLQRMVAMLLEPNFLTMEIPGATKVHEEWERAQKQSARNASP